MDQSEPKADLRPSQGLEDVHEELERRKQLETVRALTEEITRELNLTTLLDLVHRRAAELAGAQAGAVFLWDEAAQVLVPQAWHGYGDWIGDLRLRLGEGAAGTVAQRREGMIINDYRTWPHAHRRTLERTGITAVLAEPLLRHDRLLGVIVINNEGTGHLFTERDRATLSLFANQAAIAVENARLHEASRQHAQRLATLDDVTRSLTTSLDPEGVAQAILAAVQHLIPGAVVRLWKAAASQPALDLVGSAGLRAPDAAPARRLLAGDGLVALAGSTREPVIVRDVPADPRVVDRAWAAAEGLASGLVVPLVYRDQLAGALVIFTRRPHEFSREEVGLFRSFAAHAAIALANARLYATAQQEAKALEVRTRQLEAARALSAEILRELHLPTLMGLIQRRAMELVGAVAGMVVLWDEASQLLVPQAWHGFEDWMGGLRFRLGEGIVGVVAQRREGMIFNNYPASPHTHPLIRERINAANVLSEPLICRDRLVGVIAMHNQEPDRPYTEQDRELLGIFASHAAIAIENAQLYEAVQQHSSVLEARIKERTGELEKALRAKAEFLATMSHELRTPLNAVIGFADLLQQGTAGSLTPKQARYVSRIFAGGKHLLGLISDILDLSLLEVGKSTLQTEAIPLAPLVQEAVDLFSVQAGQKQLEVSTALDPSLSAVIGDRRKLSQILVNLVGNAVKFTPDAGRITVTARRVSRESGRIGETVHRVSDSPVPHGSDLVEIRVTDTGIGIRPEDLERVFLGFQQLDSSEGRRYAGAGIGLALVRKLVDLHGGQVWAESEGLGRGSAFVVRIPPLELARRKRILVLEDEAPILEAVSLALEDAGYAVERAQTGTQALAAVARESPDLLILDIGLPDMDGWEILKRLRGREQTRMLPVLVLTGLGDVQAWQAHALGANEFLAKPVSIRILVDTATRLLSLSGTGKQRDKGPA
jgi:signal transduction histidine kinase/CheY-like chemotaxis protein